MLGRYDRAMRARGPVGRLTLLQQAIAAIRRNNGALFYVPASFAGSWTDSAGTDPVNEVADVIGCMTDRAGGSAVATQATTANKPVVTRVPKRLGPNLVSNGGFDSGLTGWTRGNTGTQTHESGAIRVDGDSATTWSGISETTIPVLTRGKQYLVQFSVLAENTSSGAGVYFRTSSLVIGGLFANGRDYFYPSAVGNYSMLFTATVDNIKQLRIIAGSESNSSVLFDNISVREVLEWSYAMSFDGSNDSLTTNITTGNEGWVCAGVTHTDALGASARTIAYSGYGAGTGGGVILQRNGVGSLFSLGIGNNTATQIASVTAASHGTPYVASGGWDSSILFVGVNNSESSISKTLNCATVNTLKIGYSGVSNFFAGPMTAQVICPVLPSAADRAIIRKWIGSLQGQTL